MTVEQNILLNPYKKPVTRPDDDRWLDVQVPAGYLDSQLADLLTDRLAHRLPDAGRLQNRGVRSLADLDTGGKKRGKQRPGDNPSPVIVHLVPKSRRAGTIIAFKTTESKAAAIREYNPSPDSLQRILPVTYVGVVNPYQCTPGRYQNVPPSSRIIDIFTNERTDEAGKIGIELLLQNSRNQPAGLDFILALSGIPRLPQVFGFLLAVLLAEGGFLLLIVLALIVGTLLRLPRCGVL